MKLKNGIATILTTAAAATAVIIGIGAMHPDSNKSHSDDASSYLTSVLKDNIDMSKENLNDLIMSLKFHEAKNTEEFEAEYNKFKSHAKIKAFYNGDLICDETSKEVLELFTRAMDSFIAQAKCQISREINTPEPGNFYRMEYLRGANWIVDFKMHGLEIKNLARILEGNQPTLLNQDVMLRLSFILKCPHNWEYDHERFANNEKAYQVYNSLCEQKN